jgi:uncharacterized OB-fold protein
MTGIPIHWRLNNQRYKMTGTVCPECGLKMFPPRPVAACPVCAQSEPWPVFSQAGHRVQYTIKQAVPVE